MASIKQQIEQKLAYLSRHPFKCKHTSFIQTSFPYCSEGYVCEFHCSLWFALYRIDFERFHEHDPNKCTQLTLF